MTPFALQARSEPTVKRRGGGLSMFYRTFMQYLRYFDVYNAGGFKFGETEMACLPKDKKVEICLVVFTRLAGRSLLNNYNEHWIGKNTTSFRPDHRVNLARFFYIL